MLLISLLLSFGFTAEPVALKPNQKQISGVVRLIRGEPDTEVFFKDLKDSVIIPKDSKHNEIYALCNDSMKTGKPVSLIMDTVSRRAYLLPKPSTSSTGSSSESTGLDQSSDSSN